LCPFEGVVLVVPEVLETIALDAEAVGFSLTDLLVWERDTRDGLSGLSGLSPARSSDRSATREGSFELSPLGFKG